MITLYRRNFEKFVLRPKNAVFLINQSPVYIIELPSNSTSYICVTLYVEISDSLRGHVGSAENTKNPLRKKPWT